MPIDSKLLTTVVKSYAFAETQADAGPRAGTDGEQRRAEAATLAAVGDTIGEHYRLVRVLGEGMFGKVYVAQRVDVPEHQVALKILPRSLYVGRNVERELVMLATVGHPHVVQLKDHGTTDAYVWLTMPVYQGETLAERLERGPLLGLREAHDIFLPVARGLEALHEAGLRHQDVKPENIYLAQFGGRVHPILLDLGVAAEREAFFVAGTALYAAPEQIAALNSFPGAIALSERMDTYSLATTLLMALVGPRRFPGGAAASREDMAEAHQQRADQPLAADALPELTGAPRERIAEAFRRWLALESVDRPSMSQLAEQLDVLLEPEREAAHAEEQRLARQKASLQRNRVGAAGMLLVGAAAVALLVSKRQTLKLASELEEARHGRAASFDQLDTCVASYKIASADATSCAAERQRDQGDFRKALDELGKNGGAAESDRAHQLQGYAARLKTCEDTAASVQQRCAEETSKVLTQCAGEKVALAETRDAARAEAEAKGHELVALEHLRDQVAAERNAAVIERDACRSAIARPGTGRPTPSGAAPPPPLPAVPLPVDLPPPGPSAPPQSPHTAPPPPDQSPL